VSVVRRKRPSPAEVFRDWAPPLPAMEVSSHQRHLRRYANPYYVEVRISDAKYTVGIVPCQGTNRGQIRGGVAPPDEIEDRKTLLPGRSHLHQAARPHELEQSIPAIRSLLPTCRGLLASSI